MNKKIAIIIAFRDFQDKEYFGTKEVLETAGVKTTTVSAKKETAIGVYGGEVNADLIVQEMNIQDYDAVVFIGGGGALKYLDNEVCYKIIKETVKAGKVLGAICISPVILAKAGVLKNKKATVWSSPLDKGPIKILKENGAEYLDEDVVIDGKIITANGPSSATKFGETIIENLYK
jgi:protease I